MFYINRVSRMNATDVERNVSTGRSNGMVCRAGNVDKRGVEWIIDVRTGGPVFYKWDACGACGRTRPPLGRNNSETLGKTVAPLMGTCEELK